MNMTRKEITQRYRERHKETIRVKNNARNKLNHAQRAEWKFLERYGISTKDYEQLLKRQEGVCAICRKLPPWPGRNKKLHVDHDHVTNRVRGLLCMRCNIKLSAIEDREFCLMAALYLKYPTNK